MLTREFAMLLLAGALVLPAVAVAQLGYRDVEYMNHVAHSMQSEMELSRLAHTYATDPRVMRFARWILVDNSREYRRLQQLAHARGVRLPTEPSPEQQGLARRLAHMKDPEFSRQYISLEIKDHQRDAQVTARFLRRTRDRQLRNYANNYLSSTRGHLRLAKGAVGGQVR